RLRHEVLVLQIVEAVSCREHRLDGDDHPGLEHGVVVGVNREAASVAEPVADAANLAQGEAVPLLYPCARAIDVGAPVARLDGLGHRTVALPSNPVPFAHDGGRRPEVPDAVVVRRIAAIAYPTVGSEEQIAGPEHALSGDGVEVVRVMPRRIPDVP